jgi:hypothetical protein
MIALTFLDLLDIAALATITALIGDALRVIDGRRQPLLAVACCLIAVGAFVGIGFDLGSQAPRWRDVAVDLGLALYLGVGHRRGRVGESAQT